MAVSESQIRLGVAIFGVVLLVLGGIATFATDNGAGAAALITGGIAMALGSLIWYQVKGFTVGGTGFTKAERDLQLARALESAGETEAAEALRERVVAEVVPELIEPRELRKGIEEAVIESIRDLGLTPMSETAMRTLSGARIRPDFMFKTPMARTVGVEVFVTGAAYNARQGAQRRLEAAAGASDVIDGYLLYYGSPDEEVNAYIAGALTQRLEEWISRSTPRLVLAVQPFDDLHLVRTDAEAAIQKVIAAVDR